MSTSGLRVLRLLTRPNVGGPMRQAVALWHAHRRQGVRTLLVVGQCEDGEPAFAPARTEIPVCAFADALHLGPRAEGLLVLPALRRALHPRRDLRAAAALRRLVRAFAPDVVHTHTSKAGWLGRETARREGVPVVAHTYHGHVLRDYWPRPLAAVLRALEARLARRTDLLLAVSPSCRDELAQLGLGGAALQVVPPAVDVRAFAAADRGAARAALGLDDGAFAIGFAGRLVPIKRAELFVAALRRLPETVGLVFGEGPQRRALVRTAPANVRFAGATEELPALLAGLDALVVPSRREGCPLVAIEAFAAGVPVVGFDVPGVRDALATWGDGVLVPETQGAEGLAAALRALRADPARRARLVAQARAGLARFAPDAVARKLTDAYERARARGVPTSG